MQTERVAPVLLRSAHADIGSESSDWWCEIDAPCRWYHDALMLCQGWHAESNSCHGQYLDRQRLGGSDARSGYHECPFQWQGLLQYRDRQSCSSTSGIRRWGHLGVKQMMRGISSRFRSHSSLPLRSRKVYISSFTMHVWYSDVSVKNWKWLACFWITQLRRSYTSSLKRSAAWTHFSIQVTPSSRKPRISSISDWKVMFCGSKSLIGPKANGKMPVTHTVFPGSDSAATLQEEKKETKCGQWLTADALVPVSPNCSSSACRRGLSQSSTRTMRYSDVFLTLSYSFTALASSTRYSPASPSGAGSVQKSLSSGCNTRKWATVVAKSQFHTSQIVFSADIRPGPDDPQEIKANHETCVPLFLWNCRGDMDWSSLAIAVHYLGQEQECGLESRLSCPFAPGTRYCCGQSRLFLQRFPPFEIQRENEDESFDPVGSHQRKGASTWLTGQWVLRYLVFWSPTGDA